MKVARPFAIGAFGALVSIALIVPAIGGEIQVISTGNIRPALVDLQKAFEPGGADKVVLNIQGAAATRKRLEETDAGDVVIGPRPMLDALLATGKIKAGSIVDIARSSVGVVVRSGAATPDISTNDKFIDLLHSAKSIAYPDPKKGSLGGNLLAALIREWGLESELMTKTLLTDGGAPAGQAVADGKADIGINQIAEIQSVAGLIYLSPLPPALTDKIVMSTAILSSAKDPSAAKAWIDFISGPRAVQAIKAHGMDPVAEK